MTSTLQNALVVAAPICAAEHWVLLILEGSTGEVVVMDSLTGYEMSPACCITMKDVMYNCAAVEA